MVVGVVEDFQRPPPSSEQRPDAAGIDVHVVRAGPAIAVPSGQGEAADGMKNAQPASGASHPGHLPQHAHGVGQVGEEPGGQYPGCAAVPHRQPPDVAYGANRYRPPPETGCLMEHGWGGVNAQDRAFGADRGPQGRQRPA